MQFDARTLKSQQRGGIYNHLLLTAGVQQMKSFSCVCFMSDSLSELENWAVGFHKEFSTSTWA